MRTRRPEGSIRRRADGRYEVRVQTGINYSTGAPIRKSVYAHTEEEAQRLLYGMLADPSQAIKHVDDDCTLNEWLECWLRTYVADHVRQSTFTSYRTYVQKHFAPVLGQGLSPKTVINMNLCLHKALNQAVSEGLLKSNPASALNLKRGRKPQITVLTRDQQARLLEESRKHRYGVFIRLTLATGLRIGEVCGLRWDDIDLSGGVLYVRRSLGRLSKMEDNPVGNRTELALSDVKSENSRRSIPLLRGICADLEVWRNVQQRDIERIGADAFAHPEMVLTNEFGGLIEPRTLSDYYHTILKAADLPHFTFHALRHTFATRALEQGMDAKTLSTLLGHCSVAFTLDTYTHVLDDQKRSEMARLETLFDL